MRAEIRITHDRTERMYVVRIATPGFAGITDDYEVFWYGEGSKYLDPVAALTAAEAYYNGARAMYRALSAGGIGTGSTCVVSLWRDAKELS